MASKKLMEVFDHSAINFMVGCTILILSINDFNLFSPCSYKKNMSSVYLHHKYSLYSDSFTTSSSSSFVNKMLYRVANLLPIAVPRFCLSVFFPNVNVSFYNITSAKSIMVSVETYFSFWVSSHFINAHRPSSCSMFGYSPLTSIVHKIIEKNGTFLGIS